MLQEVLIVREYHVVERMVVPHEDACIIVDILEFDGITIKCHFVTAGVIIEPKVVEAVTRSLSFVGGVTYIKHDSWFLAEELFKDSGHHFKNLWVVGAMFMLSVIDEKVIGTIIHEDSVFVETDGVVYLLVGHEAESEVAQLLQNVGRTAESVIVLSVLLVHEPAHATSRGHQSSAGKPRHTAQGCRSV